MSGSANPLVRNFDKQFCSKIGNLSIFLFDLFFYMGLVCLKKSSYNFGSKNGMQIFENIYPRNIYSDPYYFGLKRQLPPIFEF